MSAPLNPFLLIALVGVLAGIAYWALGVAAIKYLPPALPTDRPNQWTLLWIAEFKAYSAPGKRLCAVGIAAFLLLVAASTALVFFS